MKNEKTLALQITSEQMSEVEKAWLKSGTCRNRSQYVRKAINAYSGVKIFPEVENENNLC